MKPTQPAIAHDEAHEVGELICFPLWNCVKAQVFSVKQTSYYYSPNSASYMDN